jgi:hypothetical protein
MRGVGGGGEAAQAGSEVTHALNPAGRHAASVDRVRRPREQFDETQLHLGEATGLNLTGESDGHMRGLVAYVRDASIVEGRQHLAETQVQTNAPTQVGGLSFPGCAGNGRILRWSHGGTGQLLWTFPAHLLPGLSCTCLAVLLLAVPVVPCYPQVAGSCRADH